MSNFNILHLSDLHIGKNDPVYERVRELLILDVLKVLEKNDLKLDAVVVTGDVLDRGGSTEGEEKAISFFEKVLAKVKLSGNELIIVPGNHDIPRRLAVTSLLEKIDYEEYDNKEKCEEYWETLEPRFKNFFNFTSKISEIDEGQKGMFGGLIRDVSREQGTIRFILLNSAWSTTGDDFGKLILGRWQLESIKKISQNLNEANLTLALSHHPLNWLNPKEKALTMDFLCDPQYIPVDAILHGHIHNGQIETISDPDKTLTSLVSGIGYPEESYREKGRPKLSQCRYAIYKFDIKNCSVEVLLRISRENGNFVADTSLYQAGGEGGNFKLFLKQKGNKDLLEKSKKKMEVDPVPLISGWVGRNNEIKRLLNPKLRAAALTGVGGQGKTGLAAEFLRRNARGGTPSFERGVWLDCRELPDSLHVKIIQLLEALSEGSETAVIYRDEKIEETAKRFLKHLQHEKTLVVFDNIDAYVKEETGFALGELKPVVDVILNNEHESMILFTCRSLFNDPRASFLQIPLGGLNADEGIELFKNRNINLIGNNSEEYCVELIRLTNGHPWWLGLIAGQVDSKRTTLKDCVDKLKRGEVIGGESVKEYFKDIWNQLKKDHRHVLRSLVEAPRPLTNMEINQAVPKLNYQNTQKSIRKLEKLGLIEHHEGPRNHSIVQQVHPLVREYVHESYTPAKQRPYVSQVLYLFLPRVVVDTLFVDIISLDKYRTIAMSPLNLSESIETCLNSRYNVQALWLLERYQKTLYDRGYHHQFRSFACRVLDSTDWQKEEIGQRMTGIYLLNQLLWQLELVGETERSTRYLKQFENAVDHQTIAYLYYLSLASYLAWLQGRYEDSIQLSNEYIRTAKEMNKHEANYWNVEQTKALALRDSGNYEEALPIFENLLDKSNNKAPDLGNYACCLLRMKKFEEAEKLLRESLILLKNERGFTSSSNIGYAYLWLAESKHGQKKIIDANAFLTLAREVWEDYAPGLLYKVDELENFLFPLGNLEPVMILEAKHIEERFIGEYSTNSSFKEDSA